MFERRKRLTVSHFHDLHDLYDVLFHCFFLGHLSLLFLSSRAIRSQDTILCVSLRSTGERPTGKLWSELLSRKPAKSVSRCNLL